MRTLIINTLFISCMFAQSIIGSWDMISHHTTEINGKNKVLIRHHYNTDGRFESFIWHEGHFQHSGEGQYITIHDRLNHTIEDETYSGDLGFPTDSTMTIKWDGDNSVLKFKRLPKKPDA